MRWTICIDKAWSLIRNTVALGDLTLKGPRSSGMKTGMVTMDELDNMYRQLLHEDL